LDGLFNAGHSINDFISGFNEIMRNALIVSSGLEAKTLPSQIIKMVYGTGSIFQKMDLLRMLELSMNFETKLRYVQQPQIALESLFIKLALMDSCLVVRDILSGKVEIESTRNLDPVILVEEPKPVIQKYPEVIPILVEDVSAPVSELDVPTENLEEIYVEDSEPKREIDLTLKKIIDGWGEVIIETEIINAKISNLLEEVKLKNFSSGILSILLTKDQKFHAKSLKKDSSEIETVLQNIYGTKIKLNFTIEESSSSPKDANKQINEGDKEHPLFMKALETFEGEVLR